MYLERIAMNTMDRLLETIKVHKLIEKKKAL